jgi:hypothetical protein
MKLVVGLMFVLIVVSLFSGLYYLVRDQSNTKRTVRSLTYRIGLSIALVLLLVISAWMGWIKPHAVQPPKAATSSSSIPQ